MSFARPPSRISAGRAEAELRPEAVEGDGLAAAGNVELAARAALRVYDAGEAGGAGGTDGPGLGGVEAGQQQQ